MLEEQISTDFAEPKEGQDEKEEREAYYLLIKAYAGPITAIIKANGFQGPKYIVTAYAQYLANFWLSAYWGYFDEAFSGLLLTDEAGWPVDTASFLIDGLEGEILGKIDSAANQVGPEAFAEISNLFSDSITTAFTVGYKLPDSIAWGNDSDKTEETK